MTKNHPKPMSPEELANVMSQLELDQLDIAAIGCTSNRAIQLWEVAGMVKNGWAVVALRLLANHPELLPEAWANAGLPDGRKAARRGRPKKQVGE
ncbi:MAG: hypothetical protein L3J67_11575 [Hyphomicrobiaceae bacterium]|nr:hypothetical protein [Hyphomicrobiaceae bacterium]